MGYHRRILDGLGYRYDTPTWQEIVVPSGRMSAAYCTSDHCAGYLTRVYKGVPAYVDYCPDCGHALVWGQATTEEKKNWPPNPKFECKDCGEVFRVYREFMRHECDPR